MKKTQEYIPVRFNNPPPREISMEKKEHTFSNEQRYIKVGLSSANKKQISQGSPRAQGLRRFNPRFSGRPTTNNTNIQKDLIGFLKRSNQNTAIKRSRSHSLGRAKQDRGRTESRTSPSERMSRTPSKVRKTETLKGQEGELGKIIATKNQGFQFKYNSQHQNIRE